MSPSRLAVTGVTGAVGGAVARLVGERGLPVRFLLRDPCRLPRLGFVDGDSEVAVADYGSADVEKALESIDTLFMVSAGESVDRVAQHENFIAAARRAGVQHVVYLSFLAAGPDADFTLARDHYATEECLKASGMRWTMLRDSFYADIFEEFAGADHVLRGPAGNGRLAPVARADVARAVAAVLEDVAVHAGATYELTGPESLGLAEIARILTEVRGSEYRYVDETIEEAYASRASYGAEQWQVDAWVSTYTAIASGVLDVVTDDVERLTGAPATSYESVVASAMPFGAAPPA